MSNPRDWVIYNHTHGVIDIVPYHYGGVPKTNRALRQKYMDMLALKSDVSMYPVGTFKMSNLYRNLKARP